MFVDILINLYVGVQTKVCELILTRFCSANLVLKKVKKQDVN